MNLRDKIINLRDKIINRNYEHEHKENCEICEIIDELNVIIKEVGLKLVEEKA